MAIEVEFGNRNCILSYKSNLLFMVIDNRFSILKVSIKIFSNSINFRYFVACLRIRVVSFFYLYSHRAINLKETALTLKTGSSLLTTK